MSKTSSQVKQRYNQKTYQQFKFNVRKDEELFRLLEVYQQENPQKLSALIKSLLYEHFTKEQEGD